MKQYGGADLGDRTLIDALQPALEALQKGNIQAAAQAAQRGASNVENGESRRGTLVVCQ